MSDRIINFTKARVLMLLLSLLVIAGGVAGIFVNDGFNLGIDFLSGINMRVQIAEKSLEVSYSGSDRAVINIREGVCQLNIIREGGLQRDEHVFALSDYPSISALAEKLSEIEGITATQTGDTSAPASSIVGLNYAEDITSEGVIVNRANIDQENYVDIAEIRSTLSSLGNLQIQIAGRASNQEFIIRMQDKDGERDFNTKASSSITSLLGQKYGADNIVVKQTDYVGPRFSESIGFQSVTLTAFALILILAYIWFRFKLAYAVSAISALVHDVAVMIGVIGTFQIEVNTATIAAVLTIIGYSLNDTIVIFDRIRENQNLLREKDFEKVVNISITQSLGRTLITSLTTLLAVAAIYIFGTGVIKIFALNLIIGVVVGTYSSIFIASPILLKWVSTVKKRNVDAAEKKYSVKPAEAEEKKLPEEKSAEPVNPESSGESVPKERKGKKVQRRKGNKK